MAFRTITQKIQRILTYALCSMHFALRSAIRTPKSKIKILCHLSSAFRIPQSPAVLNPDSLSDLRQPLLRPVVFQDHWVSPAGSRGETEQTTPGGGEPFRLPAATAGRPLLKCPAAPALLRPDSRSGCTAVRRELEGQYQPCLQPVWAPPGEWFF